MPAPLFIHIRHGETDWNAARRLQGSQDIPLNAHGESQARRNGRALASAFAERGLDPTSFAWVASPMRRARRTMELVRGEMGLDPAGYLPVPALRELSFGRYEGLTYEDIEARHPDDFASLRADKWRYLPPGGESYVMLRERVAPWYAGLAGPTVVVSHGGVYRALKSLLLGRVEPGLAEFLVPQDRISLWRDGEESWV